MSTYNHTHHDYHVMPDKRTTGLGNAEALVKHTMRTDIFGTGVPEHGTITLTKAMLDACGGVFNDIWFDGASVYVGQTAASLGYSKIEFHNCHFYGRYPNTAASPSANYDFYDSEYGNFRACLYPVQIASGSDVQYICVDCKFEYYVQGPEGILINCYSDKMRDDSYKFGGKTKFINCYAGPGGWGPTAHADGAQWIGGSTDGLAMDGVRFDCYSILKRCPVQPSTTQNDYSYANAGLYFDHQSKDVKSVSVKDGKLRNIWANGGGYSLWTNVASGYEIKHCTLRNAWTGCSFKFGRTHDETTDRKAFDDTHNVVTALISSVWKEQDGIHFLATNYTNEARNIIVRTSEGVYTKNIAKCPTDAEYTADRLTYASMEDFPIDVEFTIPDSAYMVAYDTSESPENQIRYVNFEEGGDMAIRECVYKIDENTIGSYRTDASTVVCGSKRLDQKLNEVDDGITAAENVSKASLSLSGDASASLDPNKFYEVSGAPSSITVALTAPSAGKLGIYAIQFTVSDAVTFSFELPDEVAWGNIPEFEDGGTYQVTIMNGIALYCGA